MRTKETPLHDAAKLNENPMVIEALLAAGADPMARDKWDDTPLDEAKYFKNVNAIKVLRRKGGTPILSTHDCRMWQTEVFFRTATVQDVKACLEAGADPNARTKDKSTPLHFAGDPLLAAGADPARTKDKLTTKTRW